jgi:hypothetical protein
MITVKILKEGVRGADDGATVLPYAKGKEYTVSEALAEVFIEAGEAEEIVQEKPTATEKVKAKAEKAAAAATAPVGLPPLQAPGK